MYEYERHHGWKMKLEVSYFKFVVVWSDLVSGVFSDLSKPFETVDHSILRWRKWDYEAMFLISFKVTLRIGFRPSSWMVFQANSDVSVQVSLKDLCSDPFYFRLETATLERVSLSLWHRWCTQSSWHEPWSNVVIRVLPNKSSHF